MITPVPGTVLRFNDNVFKVVEVTTTKATRWVRDPASFREVDVPAVAVLESHPSWAGWHRETRFMHLSYWKSMCTRGATELPADWQPPEMSAARALAEEKEAVMLELKGFVLDGVLPEGLFLRVRGLL